MTASWTNVLLAFSVLTRAFSWPGALETDGRAISALATVDFADGEPLSPDGQRVSPDTERLSAIDRLIARHGLEAATPFLAPLLGDREPTVRAGRRLMHWTGKVFGFHSFTEQTLSTLRPAPPKSRLRTVRTLRAPRRGS